MAGYSEAEDQRHLHVLWGKLGLYGWLSSGSYAQPRNDESDDEELVTCKLNVFVRPYGIMHTV